MKKLSMAGIFKSLASAALLALAASGTTWANDHLLSINGATVLQQAIITDAGAVTQPLILGAFDTPPANVTLGQSQTLTVARAFVKLCKPGTKGQLEWLDQGNAVVGVTGVLTGTVAGPPQRNYRMTLTMSGIVDTYSSSNGPCSTLGQKTFTFTGGALIERQSGSSGNFNTVLNTTYNFGSVTNRTPEPATLLLMLTGLLALGWVSVKRTHAAHRAAR